MELSSRRGWRSRPSCRSPGDPGTGYLKNYSVANNSLQNTVQLATIAWKYNLAKYNSLRKYSVAMYNSWQKYSVAMYNSLQKYRLAMYNSLQKYRLAMYNSLQKYSVGMDNSLQ